MTRIDRRDFLVMAGVAGAVGALSLAGCAPANTAVQTPGTVTWWDQFQPLEGLQQRTFESFSAQHPEIRVDYTVYNPASLGSALQLAQQSDQMPDVFSNAFGIPAVALVKNGWVSPVRLDDVARRAFGDSLVDGLHVFDGEVYSFPLFAARQHSTLTWFDRRAVEQAGGDAQNGPRSWDEFRAVARKITQEGSMHGWIEGLMLEDRLRQHVVDLATGAGAVLSFTESSADAPGVADARTGEYVYDSVEFIETFEFLGSLVRDGVMFPSSTSLDVRTARARWAGGAAGLFFDGPWNVGVLNGQFPEFMAGVGVGAMPTPDGKVRAMNGPAGGAFWLSRSSTDPEAVTAILNSMATAEYAAGMATAMDQPPADLDAVLGAEVPDLYKRGVTLMQESVRVAPSPIVRNPSVGEVITEMNQIRPTLGEITQGYLGGNVEDIRAELRSFRSRLSAERERAIAVVRSQGYEVSIDDWRFSDEQIAESDA